MSIKKQYAPGFKAKLAIELISDKKSVVEISSEHKMPQTNLHEWKAKLLDSAKDIFLPESERNKQLKILEQEINILHKLIGEITVENNFLKKIKTVDYNSRVSMLDIHDNLSIRQQARLLDTVNKAYLIDELMDFLAKINKIFAGIVYLFQKNLIICSKKDFIHQLNKLC